jgi:acyl carrier protein
MTTIDLKDVESIVRNAFPTATLTGPVQDLKLGDIDEWDSLGNFNLLLAFEEFYDVRFSMDEMAVLKSIAKIIEVLSAK